ncbi:hypothetical protein ACFL6R_06265 [Gemmatimonadota bacterium]
MRRGLRRRPDPVRLLQFLLIVSFLPRFQPVCAGTGFINPPDRSARSLSGEAVAGASYRHNGRESTLSSGDWVPADADIHITVAGGDHDAVRAFRTEIYSLEEGERVLVEVPGLQEWDKQTRKWIHADLDPGQAAAGRWLWSGTFRPGDRIVIQWRDADSGLVVPHPVTLRIVDSFGAKLAFATPVSVVFPVTGDATVTASAGFSVRYYRVSNRPFWKRLEGIGFPAITLSYATIGGRKSVLYSIGISAINDQLHLSYGGFRNALTANNFWMLGLSLKTSDLMAAARRALK